MSRSTASPCTNFSAQPDERDHVKVDGKLVRAEQPLHIALHKPAGFVSTRKDPRARDTIFDLLPAKFPRLFNVGRLDAQSEGLLILTNDGDLAQRLTHPRYKIDKEYEVFLDQPWDPALTPKLLRGILLDGERARMAYVHARTRTRLQVVLRQGINRQIRRMFETMGYRVERLVRTRIGTLRLGDLPRGHWRPLSEKRASFFATNTMKIDGCCALVTGASAGIGREFARQLAGRGPVRSCPDRATRRTVAA